MQVTAGLLSSDANVFGRSDFRDIYLWARDVLQPEDIGFTESVHQGMTQRCCDHGWCMIDPDNGKISEIILRHFHQTYLAQLGVSDIV